MGSGGGWGGRGEGREEGCAVRNQSKAGRRCLKECAFDLRESGGSRGVAGCGILWSKAAISRPQAIVHRRSEERRLSGAMKVKGEGEGDGWVGKEMQCAQELRGGAHKYSRRRRRRLQRRSEGVEGAAAF